MTLTSLMPAAPVEAGAEADAEEAPAEPEAPVAPAVAEVLRVAELTPAVPLLEGAAPYPETGATVAVVAAVVPLTGIGTTAVTLLGVATE